MKQAALAAALFCVLALSAASASLAAPTAAWRLHVLVTAYAPGCGDSGHGTATGTRTGWGVIAVDPAVIPMYSRVYVPGYGMARALDTGGAIRGAHIDVWMPSCRAAIRATRYTTITVFRRHRRR